MLGHFYRQLTFRPKPIPDSVRVDGKTAIVTGANVGLGLEVSKELASHGLARVIMGVRNVQKGEEARREILAANPECEVEVWEVDHESFESMRRFGERTETLDRLDIVVLNAGVKVLEFALSKTGHEMQVQVNHIGTAFLSLLLLDPLRRRAKSTKSPSRLTFVSSETHFFTRFEERLAPNTLVRMDEESSFKKGDMNRYNTSKLLGLLWARELSRRVSADEVLINMVNPGFCSSQLHRTHSAVSAVKSMTWTSAQGGHCIADAVTGYEGLQGVYVSEQQVKDVAPLVRSADGQKVQTKIWNETVELLQKELPSSDLITGLGL